MSYYALKQSLNKRASFSQQEIEEITSYFQFKQIKKNDYFIKQGQITSHEGFVTKGLFKQFIIDKNDKEHTLFFSVENMWISDITSFLERTPSQTNIKALEDSEILIISIDDEISLLKKYNKLETMLRIMMQKATIKLQKRLLDNLMKTAEERYLEYLTENPNISKRLTNLNLASYLGVTPEFISIIRRKISNHQS